MKRILLSVFILFFIACWSNSFGQKVDPENYDKFIEEVYGGTIYTTPEHKDIYISRMKTVIIKEWDGQEYPILESLYLNNKYNHELKYDDYGSDYSPNNFNPLKYFINYNTKQVFRIRESKYMVVIEPNL